MRKSMRQNHDILLTHSFCRVTLEQCQAIGSATAQLVMQWMHQPEMQPHGARIWLHGGLGAGKTTWVRAFLTACGISGRIKSPSFSVVESYQAGGVNYHHLDFYRQSDPTTWQTAGLRDLISERAVTLIEWPEHAHGLPLPHIDVALGWPADAHADEPRDITMTFFQRHDGPGLQDRLAASSKACG